MFNRLEKRLDSALLKLRNRKYTVHKVFVFVAVVYGIGFLTGYLA